MAVSNFFLINWLYIEYEKRRLSIRKREGKAAACRALRILARDTIRPQRITAMVWHAICCCGACAAICPNSATLLGEFEDQGVMAELESALG